MGNSGLLIIRLAFGIYMAYYGFPKFFSGPTGWQNLGYALAPLGITFLPVVWGFLLAAIEFIGGCCLALGMLYRGASFLLFFRSALFLLVGFLGGSGLEGLFPGILQTSVFLGLFLLGEGHYALFRWIR